MFRQIICVVIFIFIYTSTYAQSADNEKFDLHKCIEVALKENFDIIKAREAINRQIGLKIEARAANFPTISIAGNIEKIDEDRLPELNGAAFGTDTNWTADIIAEQTIFAGARNYAGWSKAKYLEQASKYEFQGVVNDVLLQVQERFYALILASKQVKVQEEELKLLEEILKNERAKLEVGTVSDFTVLRAEVALANSRTPLIRSQNDLRLSYEELAKVLGINRLKRLNSDQPLEVEGELEFIPIELDIDTLIKTAIKNRPEIHRAELVLKAEKEGVTIARSGFLPTLSVYSAYGADKSRFSDNLGDREEGWRAGARVSWNIFDSFATYGRVQSAESQKLIARSDLKNIRLGVDIEVRRAYSSFLEAKELTKASSKVVEQAEESLRLARVRADAGSGIQLDILDSQVALTEAKSNKIRALHDYNLALAKVNKAIGKRI